jgi:FSR family fosmidomycin resistance protein-like MFS transporter
VLKHFGHDVRISGSELAVAMKKRTFLTWFALGHLANDWPIASLWLIVPTVGIAMELSPTEVGLLFTIFNVGGALAYLPAGILTDHVSNRGRLLVATFWWVAVGYVLAAMAPGYWSLALLLAVAGMGNAAWHPIAAGVLTRESRERRAHALGIHAIGGSLAEVLAPLSVGFLLAYIDWRGALVISVFPTVLLGICFFWVARAVPRVERKSVSKQDMLGLLNMWRQGNGLRMVVMICLYNMALMALLSMIPLYLADRHGFGPEAAGIAFSTMLIVGALAQPWVGKISDIVGRRPVVVFGTLTAALASALLVFQPSLWVMIAAMMVAVAALDAIRAAILAGAVDHTGHSEGTTLGLAFVLLDGIGALGAVLAGIAAGFSWPHMFGLAAAFSLGAAALGFVTVFRR